MVTSKFELTIEQDPTYLSATMPVFSKLSHSTVFPEEVLERILKNFNYEHKEDRRILKICSLVAQPFYRIVYPIIFKTIRVKGVRKSPVPFAKMIKALEQGVIIGEVVEKVELYGVEEELINCRELYLALSLCSAHSILALTPKARILKLYGIRLIPCPHSHNHPPISESAHCPRANLDIILDGVVLDAFDPNDAQPIDWLTSLKPSSLNTTCVFSDKFLSTHDSQLQIPHVYARFIEEQWLSMLRSLRGIQELQLWDVSSEHQSYVKDIIRVNAATLQTLVIGADLGYTGEAGQQTDSISQLV